MAPETPSRHRSFPSSDFESGDPETPPSRYFLASEDTPTRPGAAAGGGVGGGSGTGTSSGGGAGKGPSRLSVEQTPNNPTGLGYGYDGDYPSGSTTSSYESGTTSTSFGEDSTMEIMDDGEAGEEGEVLFDAHDEEDGEGEGEGEGEGDVGQPLVSRGRRRRRRRWDVHEQKKEERGLLELIPPLIIAHPLPLLPLLAILPYNFLPGGVIFFIPIISVLAILSSCAHIVIVYLAGYLKVHSFEEVFAAVCKSKYGLWAGRTAVMISIIGLVTSWLETLHPLLLPLVETYFPSDTFFRSRITWTVGVSLLMLPSLLPSRMTRSLRRTPILLALLLPVVAFLVIGRTVEIRKAADEAEGLMQKRSLGLEAGSSAGAGITTLIMFFSPHVNTLSIHSHLERKKRSSFPFPCLISSGTILALSLPLALVPYYLLPELNDLVPAATPTTPSGIFAGLPADDAWVNLGRVLMCVISLGTCNMWILRGRDAMLAAMGVERGERQRAGRFVGFGIWLFVVVLACVGGVVVEKLELLGVMATLAVSWFLPALFFIITFHVRSPLAIVFPSKHPPTEAEISRTRTARHSRTSSTTEPSVDVLLARKERQLQKRRTGRRRWQDLLVYVGILPVGGLGILWTFGALVGMW